MTPSHDFTAGERVTLKVDTKRSLYRDGPDNIVPAGRRATVTELSPYAADVVLISVEGDPKDRIFPINVRDLARPEEVNSVEPQPLPRA